MPKKQKRKINNVKIKQKIKNYIEGFALFMAVLLAIMILIRSFIDLMDPDYDTAKTKNEKETEETTDPLYEWKVIEAGGKCPNNTKICVVIDDIVSSQYSSKSGTVKGRLLNHTRYNFSYVSIQFDTYSEGGAKIGDCFSNTSGLKSGETWAFEAYCPSIDINGKMDNMDITWW